MLEEIVVKIDEFRNKGLGGFVHGWPNGAFRQP